MKNNLFFVSTVSLIVIAASPSFSINWFSRPSSSIIEGMDQETAAKAIDASTYTLTWDRYSPKVEQAFVSKTAEGQSKIIGSLAFTEGKLSSAERTWHSSQDEQAYKTIEALFDVLSAANEDGFVAVGVQVYSRNTPSAKRKAIEFNLRDSENQRKALVIYLLDTSKDEGDVAVQISERVGETTF